MKVIVIGIATGSHDVESWSFEDDELCKKFCTALARDTLRTIFVIRGEIIGKYRIELPVNYIDP